MRFFIYLSYDGAKYHGWQIQPNGVSVQEVLQNSLSTLLRQEIEVVGAGRTDAGVNAEMMVAHFDTNISLLETDDSRNVSGVLKRFGMPGCVRFSANLVAALNRLLPVDIAAHRLVEVKPEAHARFDAVARTYKYYIATEKSPFNRHYSYRFPQRLDFAMMNLAANKLFDYSDFTSFSKLHTDAKTNICKIKKAEWTQVSENEWMFTITADRFLRNMVRAVVGTLLEVGRGRLTVEGFCRIIEAKDRCAAGTSVPGNALFLSRIDYPLDLFM